MKILVAIKQVPERDTAIHIAADGRSLDLADAGWTMNEPDAYALEEALQLKERAGDGEVVVLTAGPERAGTTIREALAKGADRALHIVMPDEDDVTDSLAIARTLAEAIRAESPDLILTGLQSDDLGAGATGPILAELLGLPHTTLALSTELEGDGRIPTGIPSRIKVKRELEDGWFQHVTLPLPALLTIQSGGNPLRYATLLGIKKARTKLTAELEPAPVQAGSTAQVVRLSPPERLRQTTFLSGTPAEIAAQLVEKLTFEAKVL